MPDSARNWDDFALLLIDVQKDFWTDEAAQTFPDYESNIGMLLDYCRRETLEIIHLRAKFSADKSDWMLRYHLLDRIPCVEGTPGAEILPCAEHEPGEKIIYKQTFDGFQKPELQRYLAKNKKRFLLVGGLVTSVCVLLTAASAAQKGYLVAVIDDCCGDTEEAHLHTLRRYPFIFSTTTIERISTDRQRWMSELSELGNG